MANCMTCAHNDRHTGMCKVEGVHTDLGYVLGCISWEPTKDAKIKELQQQNAKLRELVRIMHGELVSCEENGYICGGHKFDKSVSELGIEVD